MPSRADNSGLAPILFKEVALQTRIEFVAAHTREYLQQRPACQAAPTADVKCLVCVTTQVPFVVTKFVVFDAVSSLCLPPCTSPLMSEC